ncbi:Dmc1b [Giardia lamblia P15]|uniref:Dmc1b n=1 Tax=Giardia intestinalis (strain P15) TaxID=658858 RepID=E1EZY7_GIAIA|nr:Dmc1b [Giardia lamblia P15]
MPPRKAVEVSESDVTEGTDAADIADAASAGTEEATEGDLTMADVTQTKHIVSPIDDLTKSGIATMDIKRLKEAGIHTIQSLLMHTKKALGNVKGISEAKVDKILSIATEMCGKTFITGSEALKKREQVKRLSTGCADFNALLGGGVETMSITEVFGEFRTGKTQLCHTLAVTAQLPVSKGGGAGKTVYIDTEGTFRPEKVAPIAERFGLNPKKALDNIMVARVYTHEQQIECITALPKLMIENQFSLVIVDSLTALFRVDFTGRGELADRQQKLGQHLSGLAKLADEFNLAIFVTNQVMAQVDGAAMFTADPKKPIGGHILAHASTTRLYLRKGRGDTRVAKIYDSPSLAEGEASYSIAAEGIIDATE